MKHLGPILLALAGVALSTADVCAKPSKRQRFPMNARISGGLEIDAERFEAMRTRSTVLLDQVPLPESGTVSLNLRRIQAASEGALLSIDGEIRPLAEVADHLQLWSGSVVGDEDSHAFLAISPTESRGYVRRGGRMWQLRPDTVAGDGVSQFAALPEGTDVMGAIACGSSEIDQFLAPSPDELVPPPSSGFTTGGNPLTYVARIAVETDYQFFQLFGNSTAAANYVLTVIGAVSDIYEADLTTIMTTEFVGIHTSSNDGWNNNDDAYDRLLAFRNEWKNGQAPVDADLYHFMSGGSLGGGVAWLNTLCSQSYGFGVSGNMNGGLTVPITGPAPWDLVVVAHEMGHNFVTPHTHDYCPPIDSCAPPSYFGNCQTTQVCIPNGTIMSYCHICPGGLSNIDLNFHPTIAAAMRSAVESSCLQAIVPTTELCVDQPDGIHRVIDPLTTPLAAADLGLGNCGTSTSPVDYTASFPAQSWVSVSPATGTFGVAPTTLTISYDATSRPFGMSTIVLHVENDADPNDFVDIPVSVMVLPPPFRPGDQLTGSVDATDVDMASFDVVKKTKLKLTVDRTGGTGPVDVVLVDSLDDEQARWTVGAGQIANLAKKMKVAGTFSLAVEGTSSGAFSIETKESLPGNAKARTLKKLKPKGGNPYIDVEQQAVKGTTLDVTVVPGKKVFNTIVLALYDPDDDPIDISGQLSGDGLSFTGVTLDKTGFYTLRINGPTAKSEKVKVVLTPIWPTGTDTVPIE